MLRRAGRSFAMAQAPQEVKAAATDILKASAQTGGGLAEAAQRAGFALEPILGSWPSIERR